jgi:ribosomal-protein-serine acetyltransferase
MAGERALEEPEFTLRELAADQAELIYSVVDAERAHLRAWLPWVDSSREAGDTRRFLEEVERKRALGQTRAYGVWQGGGFQGVIGLHEIDRMNLGLQIGYWLRESSQGKGIMTGAVRRLMALAFEELGMERVEIRVAVGNERSAAIPERLGFRLEGVLRHAQQLNGTATDLRIYSMLRGEWAGRQG